MKNELKNLNLIKKLGAKFNNLFLAPDIAQLVERLTVDQLVTCSIQVVRICFEFVKTQIVGSIIEFFLFCSNSSVG